MKSAKAARRSSLALGSSTRGMSRVNGSSSTTMTGRAAMLRRSALLRLDVDAQRRENAIVHQVGAHKNGQFDDLALVVVLAHRVEHIVRHLGCRDHRIDI